MAGHNIHRRFLNWWIGKKREGFYIVLALLLSGLYLTGLMLERSHPSALSACFRHIGFFGFLFTLLLALCHFHLHASHQFLDLFQDTDHLPQKQIELVSSFSMTVFLSLAFLSMLAFSLAAGAIWTAITNWLSSRIHLTGPELPAQEITTMPAMAPDFSTLFPEPSATPARIDWMDRVLQAVGWICVIVFLCFLLRTLLRSAWNWVTRPRQFDDDEKIYFKPAFLLPSDNQKEGIRQSFWRRLSYSGRIRRHYRKEILAQAKKKKSHPMPSASPSELELALELEHPSLHRLYEKARYSHLECTEEDWNRAHTQEAPPHDEIS